MPPFFDCNPQILSEPMKAYCINLDRRPDRLEYITAEFARVGVPFERIPAVDAQEPSIAALAASCLTTSIGPRMSAGAYGCFQSHREFWRRLVESGDLYGMVFEDDLVIAHGIGAYLADDWLPEDADIIRLETLGTRAHLDRNELRMAGSRHLFRLRSCILGTGCYVISSKAAQGLLEITEVFREPIDQFLFNTALPDFPHLTIYQMMPAPVIQGDRAVLATPQTWVETSITERFEANATVKAELETLLARIRRRIFEEMRAKKNGTRYVRIPFG